MIACPNCQADNRTHSRFCVRCGAPLPQSPVSLSPVATRPTMPLAETAVAPPLEDRTSAYALSAQDPEVQSVSLTYEPLPEGAFIGNQYLVTQVLPAQNGIHSYYAADIGPAEEQQGICIVKESNSRQALGSEIEIATRKLMAEGLYPPLAAFQQRLGSMRYYVICPPPGTSLERMSLPVEAPLVINWVVSLSRGLADLHQQQIALGDVNAARVSVEGNEAYLADFSQCVLPGQPAQYLQEVRQMAQLLYLLLTGERAYRPEVPLPGALHELLNQIITGNYPISAADFATELTRLAGLIRRPESVDLRVGRRTDVGSVRQLNEDSLCTMELVWNNQSINQPVGLYVVADGMGGHEGGEIASGLTIKAMAHMATQELFLPTTSGSGAPDYPAWLKKAVEAANTAVYNKSKQSHNDMGTTVVAALVVGDECHIAHVGDSRAYQISGGGIQPITTDHSLVERLVATGQISREEARYHPQSNVVYRTIGDKNNVEVDINQTRISSGEYLLLCSDGLTGMVTDERIQEIVLRSLSPQAACDELIEAANAAGGDDNITVIIIKPEALAL
jgi:serine/threonine protein phosphatase PrpC